MKFFLQRASATGENRKTSRMVISINRSNPTVETLVELIKQIRPGYFRNTKDAEQRFNSVLFHLQSDPVLLNTLKKVFQTQFSNTNVVPAVTESGLVSSRGFLQELLIKLKHKLLPPLLEEDDLLFVINHVFYGHHDYIWVGEIDRKLWVRFFELLGFQIDLTEYKILGQLNQALHLLCQRVVTLGLEKEIIGALPYIEYQQYAFVKLDRALQIYLMIYKNNASELSVKESMHNFTSILNECKQTVKVISEQRRLKGTSLSQTYILFRLEQHLARIELITQVLTKDEHYNLETFVEFFIQTIYYEKRKNSIREFLNANFAFLAYQITEHGSKKGETYITTSRKEFWFLIKSALGGGIIISFTAIIKNLLGKIAMAPFWQGFSYSINYFLGFQMLHETRMTLATKQPAFTASALVNSFGQKTEANRVDLHNVAITIARTIRSQIASFAGNLVMVFPFTFILAGLYYSVTGHFLVGGEEAHKLLVAQHPYRSLSLLYACFTGFFLFLSGLVAGYVENHVNYGKIGQRLKFHPVFKNTFPPKRLASLTNYVEKNLGAVAGNLALGFFLGMAGFIGKIFGIPFDIRHITIAAGNTAIGYFAVGKSESPLFLTEVMIGVLMIGLFNFLVSFFLAFLVASRSRNIKLSDYPNLLIILVRFFKRYPADFVRPPKKLRNPNDLSTHRKRVSES
jgi:site-specific recombinase